MSRLSNRRWKEIRSLSRKKYRDRFGEALVEGVRSVQSALDAGVPIREIFLTAPLRDDGRLAGRLAAVEDRVHIVTEAELDAVSSVETSQGVVAIVEIRMLHQDELSSRNRVLLMDGVSDPGNAGTLVRTAAWFGVDAVATAPGTVDLYNPKVVRSAMGGLWDVDHAAVEDPAAALCALKRAGFAVFGADMEGVDVERWRPSVPSVLVLGSEAHGLSEIVGDEVDERVLIPGRSRRGGTESLNVAVAAGILMYEWSRGG